MKLAVTVCNVCKDVSRPTRPWVVIEGGAEYELDLCNEHAAPVVALLADAGATLTQEPLPKPPAPPVRTPAKKAAQARPAKKAAKTADGRAGRGSRVMTLAQLELVKTQQQSRDDERRPTRRA